MSIPTDRKYTKSHEWYKLEGDVVTMGITQHAADELTDITYVDLPAVGTQVKAGETAGEVESVKATAEIYMAVSGEVVEINEALADQPELVNDSAFENGWMLKIKTSSPGDLEKLLDPPPTRKRRRLRRGAPLAEYDSGPTALCRLVAGEFDVCAYRTNSFRVFRCLGVPARSGRMDFRAQAESPISLLPVDPHIPYPIPVAFTPIT
jgi:glycine cleavage system H protein